jgi:hypothetical protein
LREAAATASFVVEAKRIAGGEACSGGRLRV